jgi:hypothetical protein
MPTQEIMKSAMEYLAKVPITQEAFPEIYARTAMRDRFNKTMLEIFAKFPNDTMRCNARRIGAIEEVSEETAMNRIRRHIKKYGELVVAEQAHP